MGVHGSTIREYRLVFNRKVTNEQITNLLGLQIYKDQNRTYLRLPSMEAEICIVGRRINSRAFMLTLDELCPTTEYYLNQAGSILGAKLEKLS